MQSTMTGQVLGSLELPSSHGKAVDTCLILLNNTAPGTPVFLNLGDIRLTLKSQEAPAAPQEPPAAGTRTINGSNTSDQAAAVPGRSATGVSPGASAKPDLPAGNIQRVRKTAGTLPQTVGKRAAAGPATHSVTKRHQHQQPPRAHHVPAKAASSTPRNGGLAGKAVHSPTSLPDGSADDAVVVNYDIFGTNWVKPFLDAVTPSAGTGSDRDARPAKVGQSSAGVADRPTANTNSFKRTGGSGSADTTPLAAPAPSLELRNFLDATSPSATGRYANNEPATSGVSVRRSSRSRAEIRRGHLRPTPAMRQVEVNMIAAAEGRNERAATLTDPHSEWRTIRLRHNWPEGQTRLESMYSPYHAEAIADCVLCQPRL